MDKPKVPIACIRKRPGEAYCYADIDEQTHFAFSNAEHAMQHYRYSTVIRVCERCAVECDKRGIGAKMTFSAPLALR